MFRRKIKFGKRQSDEVILDKFIREVLFDV